MGKIDELKKQNPSLTISIIDILNELFGKTKYVEMIVNIMKEDSKNVSTENYSTLYREMIREFGLSPKIVEDKDYNTLLNYYRVLNDTIKHRNYDTLVRFIDLNERKLIERNDLTTYKSYEELDRQISLSELKTMDKDMETQTIKLFETDEWLILKPMSYLASTKYGSGTKWCTTSKLDPDYYYRYSKRGILIYCINKKDGLKVGAFKSIDPSYERETSFWDSMDRRVDSMELDLPIEVVSVIRNEFKICEKTNWDLLTDEQRNSQIIFLDNFYNQHRKSDELTEFPTPQTQEEPEMEQERPAIMNTRIIRLDPRGGEIDSPNQTA